VALRDAAAPARPGSVADAHLWPAHTTPLSTFHIPDTP